jgi:hypothetical protein
MTTRFLLFVVVALGCSRGTAARHGKATNGSEPSSVDAAALEEAPCEAMVEFLGVVVGSDGRALKGAQFDFVHRSGFSTSDAGGCFWAREITACRRNRLRVRVWGRGFRKLEASVSAPGTHRARIVLARENENSPSTIALEPADREGHCRQPSQYSLKHPGDKAPPWRAYHATPAQIKEALRSLRTITGSSKPRPLKDPGR